MDEFLKSGSSMCNDLWYVNLNGVRKVNVKKLKPEIECMENNKNNKT